MKYSFEFDVLTPGYGSVKVLSSKYNDVVRNEITDMLRIGITNPSASEWSLPVDIALKEDGRPCFCVDYRALNADMKI